MPRDARHAEPDPRPDEPVPVGAPLPLGEDEQPGRLRLWSLAVARWARDGV